MTDTELLGFVESLEIMLPDTYAEHLAALKSRVRAQRPTPITRDHIALLRASAEIVRDEYEGSKSPEGSYHIQLNALADNLALMFSLA